VGERRAWADRKSEIMSRPGAGAAYDAARIRFELGEAVRLRREQLGLTQAELAERTGLNSLGWHGSRQGGPCLRSPC
jgi:ribosome-binding protein aMBF1 (putative translation factor)